MNRLERIAFLKANRGLELPKNREKMYWFFREQFRFGHREVLLDYLGIDYSNLICGFLQHGAHPDSNIGSWPYQVLPRSFKGNYPAFVWSHTAVTLARESGHNHVSAIGSPWLYLLRNKGLLLDNKSIGFDKLRPNREILIVPAHGSGHSYANPNYSDLVSTWRTKVGDVEASVLLYYTEFCDPHIRRMWLNQGFKVECSGMAWGAEHRTIWTYNGGRPTFLSSTLEILSRHKEVVCTSPTTLATYACSLGIPTSIQLVPDSSNTLGVVNEGKGVARLRKYKENLSEHSRNLLGPNYMERDISEEKINRALKYLGLESFKSPEELSQLLPLKEGMIPIPSKLD